MNTCPITNKKSNKAGGYSNRTRATQFNPTGTRSQKVNFQKKKVYVPSLDASVKLKVSAKGLKVIQKKGAEKAFRDAGIWEDIKAQVSSRA